MDKHKIGRFRVQSTKSEIDFLTYSEALLYVDSFRNCKMSKLEYGEWKVVLEKKTFSLTTGL